jgi:hypothetical protein
MKATMALDTSDDLDDLLVRPTEAGVTDEPPKRSRVRRGGLNDWSPWPDETAVLITNAVIGLCRDRLAECRVAATNETARESGENSGVHAQ